jgi:hypothetical protein
MALPDDMVWYMRLQQQLIFSTPGSLLGEGAYDNTDAQPESSDDEVGEPQRRSSTERLSVHWQGPVGVPSQSNLAERPIEPPATILGVQRAQVLAANALGFPLILGE